MKWLRAIRLGLLLWILIFLEISITMFGLGLSNLMAWTIHYISLLVFGVFVSWRYYKTKDRVNGFILGLVMLITGIILDIIITVPFFIIPQGGSYLSYFSQAVLLVGFLESVVIVGVYDICRRKS